MKNFLSSCTLALALSVVLAGCGLLDVENPNNLVEGDLSNPAAAPAMANGAEASVTRAMGQILKIYCTATDELVWTGSRDAFQQLDFGNTTNPFNEFTDGAFPFVAEARWQADNFVSRLEAFRDAGSLTSPEALGRTYLYKAIIYTTIADMFDDFARSDRTEPAAPEGEANMVNFYDEALAALNSATPLLSGDNLVAAEAMKARVMFSKALWGKVHPGMPNMADPLVNDAAAATAAQAALDMMGSPDWTFDLVADGGVGLANDMAAWVNDRREMTFGDTYVQRTAGGNAVEAVTFPDMIDGGVHPYLDAFITGWVGDSIYPDMTVVSAREMHLILAEVALASGGDFTTHINNLRAIDGLTPYSGQVDAQALLVESRQVSLFLQGRRLHDHYRFGVSSPEWISESDAVQSPGSFLPITIVEIEANPLITLGQ